MVRNVRWSPRRLGVDGDQRQTARHGSQQDVAGGMSVRLGLQSSLPLSPATGSAGAGATAASLRAASSISARSRSPARSCTQQSPLRVSMGQSGVDVAARCRSQGMPSEAVKVRERMGSGRSRLKQILGVWDADGGYVSGIRSADRAAATPATTCVLASRARLRERLLFWRLPVSLCAPAFTPTAFPPQASLSLNTTRAL